MKKTRMIGRGTEGRCSDEVDRTVMLGEDDSKARSGVRKRKWEERRMKWNEDERARTDGRGTLVK